MLDAFAESLWHQVKYNMRRLDVKVSDIIEGLRFNFNL
jgi:hypothetical protein